MNDDGPDRLKVVTYNTYRERRGRDAALDALLQQDGGFVCLQEVGIGRALEILRRFGRRAYLSPVMHGWQYLATVLPEDARFVGRRAAQLNSRGGVLPINWSLRRARELRRVGRRSWRDGLATRVVQVSRLSCRGREVRLMNTHLPYERGLRDRCLSGLDRIVEGASVVLVGDLNATNDNVFLADFLRATRLRPAGDDAPTHDGGRRIVYVLYRGGFQEADYSLERGPSDHRVVRAELEVFP